MTYPSILKIELKNCQLRHNDRFFSNFKDSFPRFFLILEILLDHAQTRWNTVSWQSGSFPLNSGCAICTFYVYVVCKTRRFTSASVTRLECSNRNAFSTELHRMTMAALHERWRYFQELLFFAVCSSRYDAGTSFRAFVTRPRWRVWIFFAEYYRRRDWRVNVSTAFVETA